MGAAYLQGPPARPQKAKVQCEGKIRFTKPSIAHEVNALRKATRKPYLCHFCGGWHLAGGWVDQQVNKRARRKANLVRVEPFSNQISG